MDPYRLILVDDHTLFRQGLRGILEETGALEVVGEAGDGLELLNLLNSGQLAPNMIILDISMPYLRGIELIPKIKMTLPDVKVLIVTMHREKEYLYQSLAAGADGYFLKEDPDTELFQAIEKIRQGKIYVSQALSTMVHNWKEITKEFQKPLLTPREREVLKLIAEGRSNKEIASHLFISIHTVARHRANMMKKLDLKNTADLVKFALEKGYA